MIERKKRDMPRYNAKYTEEYWEIDNMDLYSVRVFTCEHARKMRKAVNQAGRRGLIAHIRSFTHKDKLFVVRVE